MKIVVKHCDHLKGIWRNTRRPHYLIYLMTESGTNVACKEAFSNRQRDSIVSSLKNKHNCEVEEVSLGTFTDCAMKNEPTYGRD